MHVGQDLGPWLDKTPQPIALALGRVVRAMGSAEKLDACIKAAEVATRYLAAVSLASAAAGPEDDRAPLSVDNFVGSLSFGAFEKAARAGYSVGWNHPLRNRLRASLRSTRRQTGLAGQRIEEFVRLRNELGHSITPADEARARSVMELHDPIGAIIDVVESVREILALPLLVVLSQQHRRGRLLSHVAFFAGEREPIPQEIELLDPIFEWETPYLCTREGLLPLEPGVVYAPKMTDGRLGLHLLDRIDEGSLRYKNVHDGAVIIRADGVSELADWIELPFAVTVTSQRPTLETINCLDGRTLYGFLSGQPVVRADMQDATSVRDVEQHANRLGLGAAYRDILYSISIGGRRAELTGSGVRVVTLAEPPQVLATIELTAKPSLLVVLFHGGPEEPTSAETEVHEVIPGQAADGLLARINELTPIAAEPAVDGN